MGHLRIGEQEGGRDVNILAINGSPRRENGTTEKVLANILAAANSLGHTSETMYLADENPERCAHCGHSCFTDGRCTRESGATDRSERILRADALILGSPVYCWQPNALTCMLFDKFRIPGGTWLETSRPGAPALGIAVAGGTGTGVFPALQSIYAWFCAWRFVPLSPVPVTRYNLDRVLASSKDLAVALLETKPQAFSEKWDQMLLYDQLPYMSYGRIDEFGWLAAEMAEYMYRNDRETQALNEVKAFLQQGNRAKEQGADDETAKNFLAAFESAFPHCS